MVVTDFEKIVEHMVCARVTHMLALHGAVLERWRMERYGEERCIADYS